MASLTHVCMWSEKDGWISITAEDAAVLHPYGTVSAHSGLFMCELCGQYVTLTHGSVRIPYFKHSAYEESKDCPERISRESLSASYNPQEHNLPIRITNISNESFEFELGFTPAPLDSFSNNLRIHITPSTPYSERYTFNKERFDGDRVTYLSIGERPSEKYNLDFENGSDELHTFWPAEVEGINPKGTLFEKSSGKKLTYDADVEVKKEYYLLIKQQHLSSLSRNSHQTIVINELLKKQFETGTKFFKEAWFLYEICALEFNEEAAKFFLNFHYRLTEQKIYLQPVWPLFTEDDYIIKHDKASMTVLVKGNISSLKTFPSTKIPEPNLLDSQTRIYEVPCSGRQELISVGRTKVLEYTYFWKEPLNQVQSCPTLSVSDLDGNEVPPGDSNTLPYKKSLYFNSKFDGKLILLENNQLISKERLVAGETFTLSNVFYGLQIQVTIGLDLIWQLNCKKHQSPPLNNEISMMHKIHHNPGPLIPAPHSLRNILLGMEGYPQISQWIRNCIHKGYIPKRSYRKLQNIYRNLNANTKGDLL